MKGMILLNKSIFADIDCLPYPERIKRLAELAGKADPDRSVFGSKKTDYKFAPPVSLSRVREVEEKYGVSLPQELVIFFTEIGNGGAGIDYGMYSLEYLEQYYISDTSGEGFVFEPEQPSLFDRDDPDMFYYEKALATDELDKKYQDAASKEISACTRDIIRNLLVIGTAGCTYDYFIVLAGKKKGMVGKIDWNLIGALGQGPIIYDMTLFQWLEDHFKRVILDETVTYGTFRSVNYRTDIGGKRRAPFREYTKEEKEQAAARVKHYDIHREPPRPAPAPQPAPPPRPAPQPAPPPPPQPVPPPQPQRRVFRPGQFIKHKHYGSGMITNVVGNIITADFQSAGPKSMILPYDEKDIL